MKFIPIAGARKNEVVRSFLILWFGILLVTSCTDEDVNVPVNDQEELIASLDIYIDENFVQEYNVAVRYKFKDHYVRPGQQVAPVKLENVIPMLDFIQHFWIDPYMEIPNGEEFFRRYVPSELIFLGGLIFNGDGTVTLGTADAGARITFTDINSIDPDDLGWRTRQFNVVYHEFAHSVHQNFKLPTAFETISPSGYSSAGSWFNLTDEDALMRGFVSPYATSSPNEDFAETVSFFLFDPDFQTNYIDLEDNCITADCENKNAGRKKLLEKIISIQDHYEKTTGVDLQLLRNAVQSRL